MVTGENDDSEPQSEEEEQRFDVIENATDFNENMKKFINNFGVSIHIPSYYPQRAAIFPQDPSIIL